MRPRSRAHPWLMLGPSLFAWALFVFLPLGVALYQSFFAWDMLTPPVWVGTDNYAAIAEHGELGRIVGRTLGFSVLVVAGAMVLGLALAVLLDRPGRLYAFVRGSIFSAYVVSWVAVAYLLAMASFTPIFGRLADMVGRKLLYTGGFLLFIIGSGLCGFATDLPMLIAFRILQSIGAALLTSNSIAIIVMATGPKEHGRGLGLQSAAQAIGLGVGPAIGGLILDTLGWQWAFWINVPVGLVGLVLGWLVIPQTTRLPDTGRFDWHGALLIAPALTAMVAAAKEARAQG